MKKKQTTKSDAAEALMYPREMFPVDKLDPHPDNPRQHTETQLKDLARSFKENGWTQPIVAKKKRGGRGLIAAGHGRHQAALMLFRGGDQAYEKIPVVWVPWSDNKLRAYVVLDNKLGDGSTWDKIGLKAFMEGIMRADGETFTGFNEAEIEALMQIGESPDDFPGIGEDLEIQHQCPKCGYEWSGKAKQ